MAMNFGTISADVIAYTSLPRHDKRSLEAGIQQLLGDFSILYKDQGFYGWLVQGDSIECVVKAPQYALRIALLLKTFVKSFNINRKPASDKRQKYFNEHGIRLAVAIAPLETFDPQNNIIDGEAIYLSGRAIKNLSSSDKQKIVIRNTMFFLTNKKQWLEQFNTIFGLLDTLISKCSARQSLIIHYKLLNLSEKEISEKLKKSQSTINQHSTAAGWNAIEKATAYFENTIR